LRLRQEEIDYVGWKILKRLQEAEIIDIMGPEEPVVERLKQALTENLQAEDALNREVDEKLREYQIQMQKEAVDYRRLFQMIKTKLARERNIVI
jgi:hypothetical protein